VPFNKSRVKRTGQAKYLRDIKLHSEKLKQNTWVYKGGNISEDFEVVMVWTASIWLIFETISRLLRTWYWIFEFHKIWAISQTTERLLASEEGLCTKDLISFHLISRRWTNSLEILHTVCYITTFKTQLCGWLKHWSKHVFKNTSPQQVICSSVVKCGQ